MSGKMENFKWRIGVVSSSSKCKNIYAPYVTVSFDVISPGNERTFHSAELTYEQFKVIYKLHYCNNASNTIEWNAKR